MSKKFKFTAQEAERFNKHGIDLTVYGENVHVANVVHVSVDKGHFQEFYDIESYFIYYIYEGEGVFVLDDEKIEVTTTDLVVIPPKTKIHYFGKMKMVLTVSPEFKEENERHVRFVPETESPYEKN